MTMTMAVAVDTAAVPADETSKNARRSTTMPAVVDAELVGRLVTRPGSRACSCPARAGCCSS